MIGCQSISSSADFQATGIQLFWRRVLQFQNGFCFVLTDNILKLVGRAVMQLCQFFRKIHSFPLLHDLFLLIFSSVNQKDYCTNILGKNHISRPISLIEPIASHRNEVLILADDGNLRAGISG